MRAKDKKALGINRHIDKSIKETRGKKGRIINYLDCKQKSGVCEYTKKDKDGNIIESYSFYHAIR